VHTIIEISSTTSHNTATVVVSPDTPPVPQVGGQVAIPTPYQNPAPGAFQQLDVTGAIYRYDTSVNPPTAYILLVTDSPIT
jgi:hypothetical protein